MDARDSEKTLQEESLNSLESLIYAIKYALEDDDVIAVSTEIERTSLLEKVLAAQEWLEDVGYTSKTPEISAKQSVLDVAWKPIALRRKEAVERPIAVAALVKEIELARGIVKETMANQTKSENSAVKVYLETPAGHVATVTEHLDHIDAWLGEKVKEQEGLGMHEEPVLLSGECEGKLGSIGRALKVFTKSKKWKYLPVETVSSKTAKESEGAEVKIEVEGEGAEKEGEEATSEETGEVKGEEVKDEAKIEEEEVKLEETASEEGERDQEDL
jgi:hypoxia up-regulated 1